jgi:uncharacterized protein (DUF2141 family)
VRLIILILISAFHFGFSLNREFKYQEQNENKISPEEQTEDVGIFRVKIEGLRNDKGDLRLAIYDKEEKFLKDGGPYKIYIAEISNGTAMIETGPLSYGEYAIGILHDENINGRIDFNMFKLPKEGFGFANNPKVRVMKPSFYEAKVVLEEPVIELQIVAKYFL